MGVFKEVEQELLRAKTLNPKFNSFHEGYAVIKEELDELWDEVKKKPTMQDKGNLRKEACQVAAMAIRFMHDLTEED